MNILHKQICSRNYSQENMKNRACRERERERERGMFLPTFYYSTPKTSVSILE